MVTFKTNGKFERINLFQTSKHELNTDHREFVVLLTEGQIKINGVTLSRNNVFENPAQGFAISNQGNLEIESLDESEFIIVSADSDVKIPFTRIKTYNCLEVGESNTSRSVCRVADNSIGLQNLIVGETINPPGNWSSWPPHKHDTYESNKESSQEEVYFYKFSNDKGFGIQMIDEKLHLVKNNDSVTILKGHHPVVSSPYSQMYYFWVLYGDNSFFQVRYKE